ncbi:calcium-binding protein [Actibacterium lipolyticum]|uniref:Poly(Beta-D-mannuronate) C5 epimerase 1 n=1 Tax=Actibacterium lipolyticum TaxID=1524263 RepID=A0A238JNM7_9RHOB|nr:calcium-binding protein [Actibacterium lipolyticum]SMX32278.1 Poly(beta-D-mannuronate) C5 epimerase 1 [Actibacterium lipolyticum]
MATPIDINNTQDFDQPLNTDPDFSATHVFSTADITGTFSGTTQGTDGGVIDFSGASGIKETKEGVTLYPIDSEFGFVVSDFEGAVEKEVDGIYAEGWAGDLLIAGQQAGLVVSDAPTDTFKTPAVLGTWLSGLGGNTVKASTEHYVVMQHVLSDQKFPGDPDALYPLDDDLILLSLNPAYDGQYVSDLVNGTAMYDGELVVVPDVNQDGVIDIKDLLNPNESSIEYDIAYSSDYSVTMKDDGKLLYRWGNSVKRPNDVRIETHIDTPDEWKELDPYSSLKSLYEITSAELVVHHTITNNPNDQIRPEDLENESAIGTLPTYEVIENYNGDIGRTVWASTDDYYAGDGTLYPAGTILRDTMLADAVTGTIPDEIGTISEDLELGFTNAWYTTMDREPFEPVLNEDGTEYITGPRWRLQPDKYGQDLPSVTIPIDPSDELPVTQGEEKYEVGAETQTVINLLDWETEISPLSISAGWQDGAGTVSANGLNMTDDLDVAFYIKGDIKPATIYSAELLVDYEEIPIHDEGDTITGTAEDDYLVGVGNNEFTGGDGADLFVVSYGTSVTDVITQSVITDFEVGKDKIGLIGFDSLVDFDADTVEALDLITQGVDGDDLTIYVDDQLVATLTGVAAELGIGTEVDPGEGLSLLHSFIVSNPSPGVDPGPVEPNLIVGTNASETLEGTVGDDIITALGGDDYLYGLAGNDVLDGGAGLDRMYGGMGEDTFVFATNTGLDFVYDFEDGIDQIQLDGIDFADVEITAYRTKDVLISAGEDLMILRGVNVADITEEDFSVDSGLMVA